jgi:hypothetical protein
MAGQIQQVYINAVRFSHTDVTLKGETLQQYGSVPFAFPKGSLAAIDWSATQDSAEVQGNRIQSMGVTNGPGLATGSFELLTSEADDWQNTVSVSGQFPVMSVFFNFRLIYAVNQGIDSRVVEIIGIKVKSINGGTAKGNGEATQKYEFRAGQILVNGIALYGDPAT